MSEPRIVLPEAFALRMKDKLGTQYTPFAESLQTPPPVSIRLNRRKKSGTDGLPVPWCRAGRYLNKRPVFTLDPSFHGGAYYVQEASSMFLEQVFHQLELTSKPLRILDLSAAPGGKSTHIISLIHPESLLVANEVIRSRATILLENIIKWGYDNVIVTQNDPLDFQRLPGFFDVVVVDAPCSGEGLFRKDPQAMKEWSVEQANHCAMRQRRILTDVWLALKTNGLLIYSTCTYNPSENEENLQWLGTQHTTESVPLNPDPEWGVEVIGHGSLTGYQFYPHRVQGEGFFVSVIQKKEIQSETLVKHKKITGNLPKKIKDQVSQWIHHADRFSFQVEEDEVTVMQTCLYEISSFLKKHLNVLSAGTAVATLKGEKLIPEQALAVSINLNKDHFPAIELPLEDALNFLRKENLTIPQHKKGHALVTYATLPLGWINVLDNRINNLYPKSWRIRMKEG